MAKQNLDEELLKLGYFEKDLSFTDEEKKMIIEDKMTRDEMTALIHKLWQENLAEEYELNLRRYY